MELKLKFNEDPANYDQWRPTYVPDLFSDIIARSPLDETKQALEIGIGTGQATLPVLQTNCHVTAIELGDKLAAYAREKFRTYSNLEIKTIAFEDYAGDDNTFDLIYSATAFHWIPQNVGYPKAYRLLKSGGTLALFWNHPAANTDDPLHIAIQKIYDQYRPFSQKPGVHPAAGCQEIIDIITHYGFVNVTSKLYHNTRTFDAASYIALLNTYSDHRNIQDQQKTLLEREIAETINRLGGKFNIYDTMDLYLAQKP